MREPALATVDELPVPSLGVSGFEVVPQRVELVQLGLVDVVQKAVAEAPLMPEEEGADDEGRRERKGEEELVTDSDLHRSAMNRLGGASSLDASITQKIAPIAERTWMECADPDGRAAPF